MPFRNPYHFVPIEQDIPGTIESPEGEPLSNEILQHRSFDRYHDHTHSGRIVCRLTTVTPMVAGAKQTTEADGYTRVHPFERDGKPAIPSTSIRGCISAIAEAASNSALRVLKNKKYSRRVTMEEMGQRVEDFSALGMIVEENGELRLRPLTMPAVKMENGVFTLPAKYRGMFSTGINLKAYCYNSGSISRAHYAYSQEFPCFFSARTAGTYSIDKNGIVNGNGGKLAGNGAVLLGTTTTTDPVPCTETSPQRGILRVLYTTERNALGDMPQGKHHEIFIPYPPEMESSATYPITKEALERFHRLAKESESENKRRARQTPPQDPLPYALKGAEPLRNRIEAYQLKHGDIVFFTPNDSQEIVEVWISQIWRKELNDGAHDFFRRVNPELLPFHEGRNKITPAEAVFGFVEVNQKGETRNNARSLASRLRFSEGVMIHCPDGGCYYDQNEGIALRILAAPKPPCPSFYFRRNNLPANVNDSSQCYISKQALNANTHRPQGRKFYLNHSGSGQSIIDGCRTRHPEDNKNQKNRVKPVREGISFSFHIDFDNLSSFELGLLIYSLNPADVFHHKIGMAKALGLGTVKIDIAGIFFIDRLERYSENGFGYGESTRYHHRWIAPAFIDNADNIFGSYEIEDIEDVPDDDEKNPANLKRIFEDTISPSIKTALAKIGTPGIRRVRSPMENGQTDQEEETFRWFQNNDDHRKTRADRQGLIPLEYGENIPTLNENS